jgi:hypothetical protein
MNTPILLLTFNRPETTKQVWDAISKVKPSKIYVSSDGSKTAKDLPLINEIKNMVNNPTWNCEIIYRRNLKNLGLRTSIVKAIDWFFEQEEEGIILEDDCVPSIEFFEFCEKNLVDYRNTNIMHISGYLPVKAINQTNQIQTYTMFPWGWATWKSQWSKYINNYNELDTYIKTPKTAFEKQLWSAEASMYMLDKFIKCSRYQIDTWDYGWQYSILKHDGLCIAPPTSLITNIGFGNHATHTFKKPKVNKVHFPPDSPNKKIELELFKGFHKNSYKFLIRKYLPFLFYNFNS